MATAWPPDLAALKVDAGVPDDRDDARLQQVLDAAVGLVERVRPTFNYAGDLDSELPAPTEDLALGTLRLAGRWHTRRRSPDGLVAAGEFGTSRVPAFDADIERLLGIGRYAGPVIA